MSDKKTKFLELLLMDNLQNKRDDVAEINDTIEYNLNNNKFDARFFVTFSRTSEIQNIHDSTELNFHKEKVVRHIVDYLYGDLRDELVKLVLQLENDSISYESESYKILTNILEMIEV